MTAIARTPLVIEESDISGEQRLYQKVGEVIKNNELIRCKNELSAVQRKSFAVLLKVAIDDYIKSNVRQDSYSMPLKTYRQMMGYSKDVSTVFIRTELTELLSKILEWNIDKDGYGTRAVMLAGFELKRGTGTISWEFSSFLMNKLVGDGYTPLKLNIVTSFVSKHSIALYENLQTWKQRGWAEFTIDEFRTLMGMEQGEYKIMNNMKINVIEPAVREINEKSDMKIIGYDDLKIGPKIVGFVFRWANLSSSDIEERNKKLIKKEEYLATYRDWIGNKYFIAEKQYSLTKDGLKLKGKTAFDFIESIEYIKQLQKAGILKSEHIIVKERTLFDES